MPETESPLISVIIPTYNRSGVIKNAIQSVIHQTYKRIEIIIVDDCSDDQTQDSLSDFEFPNLIYIRHTRNKGGGAARNTGIKASKGEYIAFLDSDDIWIFDKLNKQVDRINQCSERTNLICYSQTYYAPEGAQGISSMSAMLNGLNIQPKRGIMNGESVAEYLFCNDGLLHTSTLFVSRSLALDIQFKEDLRKHQDYDFCLRASKYGAQFIFVKEPLVVWNGDPSLEHVGRQADYLLSYNFLKEFESYFSKSAKASFVLYTILPRTFSEPLDRTQGIQAMRFLLLGAFLALSSRPSVVTRRARLLGIMSLKALLSMTAPQLYSHLQSHKFSQYD